MIWVPKEHHTTIYFADYEDDLIYVTETPEEILEKLREAERRN
jgi:hypothetical protein